MRRNASWNLNPMASYPLYKQPNSVRAICAALLMSPLMMTSLAVHMSQGDALRIEEFFETRQLPSNAYSTILRL